MPFNESVSNDSFQLAYICAPARLHAMPTAIVH